ASSAPSLSHVHRQLACQGRLASNVGLALALCLRSDVSTEQTLARHQNRAGCRPHHGGCKIPRARTPRGRRAGAVSVDRTTFPSEDLRDSATLPTSPGTLLARSQTRE